MNPPRLEVGSTCVNGHLIKTEDDLGRYMQKRPGREPYLRTKCKKCASRKFRRREWEHLEEGQGHRPPERRRAIMTCSHSAYFYPQYPKVNDLILCSRCSAYRVIQEVRREASSPGRS